MISVEDVDLVNPAAGHEEALSPLQPGDAEPLDVLDGRGEAVQGGPAGFALPFVDIKTKVPSQYRLLILKQNSQFDKKVIVQSDGPPCSPGTGS